jgi:hypothetical protein
MYAPVLVAPEERFVFVSPLDDRIPPLPDPVGPDPEPVPDWVDSNECLAIDVTLVKPMPTIFSIVLALTLRNDEPADEGVWLEALLDRLDRRPTPRLRNSARPAMAPPVAAKLLSEA